jgi:hypothetical protein
VAKKPTPSKVVLLMSAAGLGLSWSGMALASRDTGNTSAGFALTFGVAQRSEQACDAKSPDGWASCPPSHGELLRTIIAETAALPLPLRAIAPASDGEAPLRVLDAYAAASARQSADASIAKAAPELGDQVSRPATPDAARVTDGPDRDSETDAITMRLLDDRLTFADDAAMGSSPVRHAVSAPPNTSAASAASRSSSKVQSHVGEAALGAASTPDYSGKPDAVFAGDRSIGAARAATADDPALADSAPIDRIFASLAEVLGSRLDGLPSRAEPELGQAAVQELATEPPASVAHATPDAGRVGSASSIDPIGSDVVLLQRLIDADEIVVAPSHSDKVLMSLAALRAGEGSETAWLGAQTKKTVVVKHTDKVLETLALFQSKKPRRTALSCTAASGEEARAGMPVERQAARELPEPADDSAMASIGQVPDIVLDLLPPAADRQDRPALQPAADQSRRSELSVAGRSQRSVMGSELVALSGEKLDEVRGGFMTDGGLRISFGIERAVYLNGNLVATTSLNIADLAKISGGQAQVTTSGTTGGLALLQNGAGNVLAPGSITSTAAGTVIQNTLDNQKINTITRIDAVVNSSGIMRSINLQSSMRSAIVDSLRR